MLMIRILRIVINVRMLILAQDVPLDSSDIIIRDVS